MTDDDEQIDFLGSAGIDPGEIEVDDEDDLDEVSELIAQTMSSFGDVGTGRHRRWRR